MAISRHFIERIGFAHHEFHVYNSSLVLCLLTNKATCLHERRGDGHGRYSFDETELIEGLVSQEAVGETCDLGLDDVQVDGDPMQPMYMPRIILPVT